MGSARRPPKKTLSLGSQVWLLSVQAFPPAARFGDGQPDESRVGDQRDRYSHLQCRRLVAYLDQVLARGNRDRAEQVVRTVDRDGLAVYVSLPRRVVHLAQHEQAV